jgi:hypothetical protein
MRRTTWPWRSPAARGRQEELARIATVATPDTILRWYRRLVAQKYDGSAKRGSGRPRIHTDIAWLIVCRDIAVSFLSEAQ